MSFLVNDKQSERHDRIRRFLADGENVIAVLLAATDFEWTIRRAILAMGSSPNAEIREGMLRHCSGLEKYKKAWTKEVKPRFGKHLTDVVSDWSAFNEGYKLRHTLVHGVAGTTGTKYAEARINLILNASKAITDFAQTQGIDLFSRPPVRRRARR